MADALEQLVMALSVDVFFDATYLLVELGIETLDDLCLVTEAKLLKSGMREETLAEIKDSLKKNGRRLADEAIEKRARESQLLGRLF